MHNYEHHCVVAEKEWTIMGGWNKGRWVYPKGYVHKNPANIYLEQMGYESDYGITNK